MARLEVGLFENFKNARSEFELFGNAIDSEQLSFNNIAEFRESLLLI